MDKDESSDASFSGDHKLVIDEDRLASTISCSKLDFDESDIQAEEKVETQNLNESLSKSSNDIPTERGSEISITSQIVSELVLVDSSSISNQDEYFNQSTAFQSSHNNVALKSASHSQSVELQLPHSNQTTALKLPSYNQSAEMQLPHHFQNDSLQLPFQCQNYPSLLQNYQSFLSALPQNHENVASPIQIQQQSVASSPLLLPLYQSVVSPLLLPHYQSVVSPMLSQYYQRVADPLLPPPHQSIADPLLPSPHQSVASTLPTPHKSVASLLPPHHQSITSNLPHKNVALVAPFQSSNFEMHGSSTQSFHISGSRKRPLELQNADRLSNWEPRKPLRSIVLNNEQHVSRENFPNTLSRSKSDNKLYPNPSDVVNCLVDGKQLKIQKREKVKTSHLLCQDVSSNLETRLTEDTYNNKIEKYYMNQHLMDDVNCNNERTDSGNQSYFDDQRFQKEPQEYPQDLSVQKEPLDLRIRSKERLNSNFKEILFAGCKIKCRTFVRTSETSEELTLSRKDSTSQKLVNVSQDGYEKLQSVENISRNSKNKSVSSHNSSLNFNSPCDKVSLNESLKLSSDNEEISDTEIDIEN